MPDDKYHWSLSFTYNLIFFQNLNNKVFTKKEASWANMLVLRTSDFQTASSEI